MNGEELTFVAGGQTYQGKVKGNRIEGTITDGERYARGRGADEVRH